MAYEYVATAVNMTTGEPVFRVFRSFQQWVNKASTWISEGDVCIDSTGKILTIGRDWMDAKYPVTVTRKSLVQTKPQTD